MRQLDQQRIWHICFGRPFGELLRHSFGSRVVFVLDDCSVGPLADVDSPCQAQRIDFWCAQVSWRDAARGRLRCVSDAIAADRREMAQLDPAADEFVVWTCPGAAEQCLLRRVTWWLSGHRATMSLATFDWLDTGMDEHDAPRPGAQGPALGSRHHLLSRFLRRSLLGAADRKVLASQWLRLREDPSMLRTLVDGQLQTGGGQKLLLPETQSRAAVLPLT